MGLGEHLRNITYVGTDTVTGATDTFTVVTEVGGAYPTWSQGAYQGGMTIPAAYRASILLSDLLGSIPWHLYANGERAEVNAPVLDQPSPPDTRMTSFSSMALDLVWHGNAVGLIAGRDEVGRPTSIVPVPADHVGVYRIRGQDISAGGDYYDLGLRPGQIIYAVGSQNFLPHEVVHVKGPCRPGALRGFGVIENHLRGSLKIVLEQDRQAGNLSTSGVPTGKLKVNSPDLTADEAAAIKASWMAAQRDRTVAVLNAVTDFEPLAWNPSETQLLDARKFSLQTVALIFGLPSSFLGAEIASRTYSNAENESLNLIKFSLAGHLARFEQALSSAMPEGETVLANLDALLRADTLSRYQAHQIGITAGFLTDDEARALEGRPPLTSTQRAQLAANAAAAKPGPASGTPGPPSGQPVGTGKPSGKPAIGGLAQ